MLLLFMFNVDRKSGDTILYVQNVNWKTGFFSLCPGMNNFQIVHIYCNDGVIFVMPFVFTEPKSCCDPVTIRF